MNSHFRICYKIQFRNKKFDSENDCFSSNKFKWEKKEEKVAAYHVALLKIKIFNDNEL